jgi:4,5-dihydroxyphthalate decarboxylase
MPNLKLTLACWDYDRTRPLMDGRVKPEGIDLDIEILRPRQAFQRMLDKKEFDVSELSLASYTALKGRGECPFVAVPVALSKIFRHSCIYVRRGAGISTPQDLKGKRVGTSQWGSTGLVFMRGMLQHDYGIRPQDMHWFMGGLNTFVEPPLIALNLPKDIELDFLSGTQTLEHMFAAGELDALLSLYIPKLFWRVPPPSRACFRTTRKSNRTITAARAFCRSCIRWCCARASIARIRGQRAASTGPSCKRAISRSAASTTPMRYGLRCRG